MSLTKITTSRPFAASVMEEKPSALARRLIREGCAPPEGFKSLADLLKERDELLMLGREIASEFAQQHPLIAQLRDLIARCEAA